MNDWLILFLLTTKARYYHDFNSISLKIGKYFKVKQFVLICAIVWNFPGVIENNETPEEEACIREG